MGCCACVLPFLTCWALPGVALAVEPTMPGTTVDATVPDWGPDAPC